jgi:type I restriction enzyme S subunit
MAFKQVRLGDYFKFEKGLGYKGEFLAEESDVALIGMDSHDEGGGYKDGSEKPYSGPYKEINVASPGDIIFAATDLTQDGRVLGSPLLVPESDEFQTYIYSHHLLKAFQKKEGFLPEYLYNLYRVEKFRKKAAYADSGTTVRALPAEVLEEQMVPLPDLTTQLAINEIISLIDQQISNSRALSRNLEALAQSIFKSWFIDFDPVKSKVKGEKPFGMDAEVAKLFPDSFVMSELGEIPNGWKVEKIGAYSPFIYGKALAAKNRVAGEVPVFGSNGVTGFHNSALISIPSVIIGRKGTIGTVNLSLRPSWAIDTAFYSLPTHSRDVYFLFNVLTSLNLDTMNSDSAVPGLNRETAHSLKICTADELTMSAYSSLVGPMYVESRHLLDSNEKLICLRTMLLENVIVGDSSLLGDLVAT